MTRGITLAPSPQSKPEPEPEPEPPPHQPLPSPSPHLNLPPERIAMQELQAPTTFAQLQKYQEELYALQANKPDEYQRLFGNLNPDDPIALEKLRTYYDRLKVQSLAIKAAYVKAQEAAVARGTPEDRKTK